MRTIHVFVSGVVQGVGFRYFTKYVAEELGIKGWVRNLEDGRVEIKATGPEESIRKFLNKIREGPPLAEVRHVSVEDEPLEEFTSFEII